MAMANSTVAYKDISGFPGYRIGSDGSVLNRFGKRLKLYPGKLGYLRVALSIRGQKQHVKKLVHRLVLETFIGPCPKGMECRHFPDHNRSNNNLSNLSWGTRKENVEDRKRHGHNVDGVKQWKAKLTDNIVRSIREEYATGKTSSTKLARKYGLLHHSGILHVIHRRTWKHVK